MVINFCMHQNISLLLNLPSLPEKKINLTRQGNINMAVERGRQGVDALVEYCEETRPFCEHGTDFHIYVYIYIFVCILVVRSVGFKSAVTINRFRYFHEHTNFVAHQPGRVAYQRIETLIIPRFNPQRFHTPFNFSLQSHRKIGNTVGKTAVIEGSLD